MARRFTAAGGKSRIKTPYSWLGPPDLGVRTIQQELVVHFARFVAPTSVSVEPQWAGAGSTPNDAGQCRSSGCDYQVGNLHQADGEPSDRLSTTLASRRCSECNGDGKHGEFRTYNDLRMLLLVWFKI